MLGLVGAFGSVLVSALGFVLIKRWPAPVDMLTLISWQPWSAAWSCCRSRCSSRARPRPSTCRPLRGFAWLAVMGTGWRTAAGWGLTRMPAGAVSLIGLVNPVVGDGAGRGVRREAVRLGPGTRHGAGPRRRCGPARRRASSDRRPRRGVREVGSTRIGRVRTTGTEQLRLRDMALAACGPTVVDSVGYGAVIPVLALRARDLGAGIDQAAFVVALLGIGQPLTSLPAGALVARIGERRMLWSAARSTSSRCCSPPPPGSVGHAGRRGAGERRDLDRVPAGPAGLHDRGGGAEPPGPGALRARREPPGRTPGRAPHRCRG